MSHRGGRPGFVQVEGNRLTIPDFAGNSYFNTLGNLLGDAVAEIFPHPNLEVARGDRDDIAVGSGIGGLGVGGGYPILSPAGPDQTGARRLERNGIPESENV